MASFIVSLPSFYRKKLIKKRCSLRQCHQKQTHKTESESLPFFDKNSNIKRSVEITSSHANIHYLKLHAGIQFSKKVLPMTRMAFFTDCLILYLYRILQSFCNVFWSCFITLIIVSETSSVRLSPLRGKNVDPNKNCS